MKKTFSIFICLIYSFYIQAQEQNPSGTTIVSKAKILNFAETAKKNINKVMEKDPPEEGDEEMDLDFKNPVINFSSINKIELLPIPLPNTDKKGKVNSACPDFEATIDNTGRPPDPNGAAGFDHIMVTVNNTAKIQKKDGTQLSSVDLPTFFSGTGHTDVYDPKVTYDPYNHRWIFVACASRESANSALLLGVSQTFDPTGNWNIYSIDADPANTNWFDYPSLGFSKNWIIVGGNMFDIPGQTTGFKARTWVINKNEAYAGNGLSIPYFDRTDYFTICPSINYDANENTAWCIANHNSNSGGNGFIKMFSIAGTAAAPTFTLGSTIQVATAWAPNGVDAPQSGTTNKVNLGDHRIQNVVYRNGRLYFCQNFFSPAASPTTCGVQVVAINPFSSTHLETQRIIDNTGAIMAAYPSITVNTNDDLAIGYCTFYTNNYPSAAYTYRRGLAGGFNSAVYRGGEDWYEYTFGGRNRWGDYTATYTDPEDNKAIWIISQYARTRSGGVSYWGTWWKKICPDICTNSFTLSGASPSYKFEANSTITSTGVVSSGGLVKYDAGTKITLSPGFRANNGSHFKAYIDGCGGVK